MSQSKKSGFQIFNFESFNGVFICLECFENKHIEIEKESRKYALELSKIKSFKSGYELLNKIIDSDKK